MNVRKFLKWIVDPDRKTIPHTRANVTRPLASNGIAITSSPYPWVNILGSSTGAQAAFLIGAIIGL